MFTKFAGIILILIFAATSHLAQEKSSAELSKDEAAIRQIVKDVEAGWNAKDGKAFAASFAPDADYVIVNGMYLKGREAIEKGHTMIFTTIYKDSRNAGTFKSVRFLRPDVAVAHVEWNLVYRAEGKEIKLHALNTMFLTKENDKWSIAAFHNTLVQPQNR